MCKDGRQPVASGHCATSALGIAPIHYRADDGGKEDGGHQDKHHGVCPPPLLPGRQVREKKFSENFHEHNMLVCFLKKRRNENHICGLCPCDFVVIPFDYCQL